MFVCSTVPDVHQATYMITLHSGTTQCIYQCGVQQVKKISPIFLLDGTKCTPSNIHENIM